MTFSKILNDFPVLPSSLNSIPHCIQLQQENISNQFVGLAIFNTFKTVSGLAFSSSRITHVTMFFCGFLYVKVQIVIVHMPGSLHFEWYIRQRSPG